MTRRLEAFVAAAALLGVMTLGVAASRGGILFSRPLWLDEYHSVLAASHASPLRVVSDVMHGPDHAPPLLHLLEWSLYSAAGSLSPTILRTMSFIIVWIALVVVYAALRRRFDVLPSVAGALAVGSNGLVVAHAFEARFYGPWLLFAAGFAWALGADDERARSRRRDVGLAVFAVLLCTIHWFGVLSLAAICAGVVFAGRRTMREELRRVAPAAAGLIALAACSPILLTQRASLTTATWIPGPNAAQAVDMARTFYLSLVPIVAALILFAKSLGEQTDAPARARFVADRSTVALLSLASIPVIIAILSWLVQPTMLTRYAITAALAWAPITAPAVQSLPRTPRVLFCLLLVAVTFVNTTGEAARQREFASQVAADARAFDEAAATRLPVVFQARHVLYPVAAVEPAAQSRMGFVALTDSTIDRMFPASAELGWLRRFFRFERDVARIHQRLYGFPLVMPQAQLDTVGRFILLASDVSLPRGYKDVVAFGRAVFPRHRATRLRQNLTLFALP